MLQWGGERECCQFPGEMQNMLFHSFLADIQLLSRKRFHSIQWGFATKTPKIPLH